MLIFFPLHSSVGSNIFSLHFPCINRIRVFRYMGCICFKGKSAEEYVAENRIRRGKSKALKSKLASNSLPLIDVGNDAVQGENEEVQVAVAPTVFSVTNGERGALVIAGWPSWLAAVAGEAINGWIPRRADSFEKFDKIGQGTYSSVYRARDLETNKIVALKKVRFATMDPESVRFMAREILLLRRLDHPNVMKLEGMITSRVSGSLYLIFDYMEHDLAGLAAIPGIKFSEAQPSKGKPLTSRVVTLWYRPPELLLGATDYGVSVDLWSSGCILAELFSGKAIMPGRTEVEQLHKIFKLCGSPSEEYWKKSKLRNATIFKPQQPYKRVVSETFKNFPSSALGLLEVLLATEPEDRGTASLALQNEFFTTEPLPCDPSTLPNYPPSKEFDVKLQQEEARRRERSTNKEREQGSVRRKLKESKNVLAPDANAELQASIEKRQRQPNSKSIVESYNPKEDGNSGFPLGLAKPRVLSVFSHSGQSMHPSAYGSSNNMNLKEENVLIGFNHDFGSRHTELSKQKFRWLDGTQLSKFSGSFAVRGDGNSNDLLDGLKLHQKDFNPFEKDLTMGYASKNKRFHYSGPLLSQGGGNIEDMLKEHERQIQQAARKGRLEKDNTKKAKKENGLTESLL
ncbi:probable serine/threonine-protein kinase At1g09600 isoform X3 [Arachis duranensis]|uniref:Probable serine/threonine-protein kinase At1g09600 isoform X3 n=1 Tax=Arachis duranensis TaxID=130453 RepID=A0A6P4D3K1_ARADU|nr:probable serine/threonine-protein kinase At1g09600 isoform X3 [Arachis duranensis]